VELNVEIKQVNRYVITSEGRELGTFSKGQVWNGLVEFKNPEGTVIVHQPTKPVLNFNSLFSLTDEEETLTEFTVAKITPSLIPIWTKNDTEK